MPAVQKPHCSAWWRLKAACRSPIRPPSLGQPFDGLTRPSTCTASVRQARCATPSICTVQAPHTPCSQPTWVPVAPSSWRRKSLTAAGAACAGAAALAVEREAARMFGAVRVEHVMHGAPGGEGQGHGAAAQFANQLAAQRGAGLGLVAGRSAQAKSFSASASASPCSSGKFARHGQVGHATDGDAQATASATAATAQTAKSPWRTANSSKPWPWPGRGERKAHGFDQFVGAARRLQHAGEEVLGRCTGARRARCAAAPRPAAPAGTAAARPRGRRARCCRPPCRGCGSGSARCAGRPAASRGSSCASVGRHSSAGLRGGSADVQCAGVHAHLGQRAAARDVEQPLRRGQPHVQHRHQDCPPARMRASSPSCASTRGFVGAVQRAGSRRRPASCAHPQPGAAGAAERRGRGSPKRARPRRAGRGLPPERLEQLRQDDARGPFEHAAAHRRHLAADLGLVVVVQARAG
jgi:hypothetical protein